MKIIIEYDNGLLANICNELYQLFLNNNYDVTILNNSMSINNKIAFLKNNTNSLLLSNKLNNNDNTIEIIYPLKNNNKLAIIINDNLSKYLTVSKYYQLRSNINTSLDYYEILRYNNEAIIIKYGKNILNTNNLALIIYQSISSYLNNKNIYIVKSGDSLYKIAKMFNTTVDELKRINNLSSNLLNINQKLIIPTNQNSNNNELNNTYIVKSGDSLYKIAKMFNTTVDELKRINNLSSNLLSIGQKIKLPSNNMVTTYIVNKGDTLYKIANKYDTTVDKIKKDNNLSSNLLSIGQKLLIKK